MRHRQGACTGVVVGPGQPPRRRSTSRPADGSFPHPSARAARGVRARARIAPSFRQGARTPAPTDETGLGRTAGFLARLRGRSRQEPDRPDPWRVEGMPRDSSSGKPEQQPRRGGFWMLLIAALLLNWIIASIVMGPPERTDVSYSFFT